MFTKHFVRLIGVTLSIAALILVTLATGILQLNSNQTFVLLLLIAGCSGGVGLMMSVGWFAIEDAPETN